MEIVPPGPLGLTPRLNSATHETASRRQNADGRHEHERREDDERHVLGARRRDHRRQGRRPA